MPIAGTFLALTGRHGSERTSFGQFKAALTRVELTERGILQQGSAAS